MRANSDGFELGAEALIPINHASGRRVGAITFLDDIFPNTLGKPLFNADLGFSCGVCRDLAPRHATAWSALIALIAPWFLIALTNLSVHEIFLAQIVIFVVLFLILSEPPLSRVFVPRRARRAQAHRAEMEQFMIRGMARK